MQCLKVPLNEDLFRVARPAFCVVGLFHKRLLLSGSVWNYTWFWIPVVGSHLGAIFGAVIYEALIGAHWPDEKPVVRNSEDDLDMQYMRPSLGSSAPVFKLYPNGFASLAHESSDPKRALLTTTPTFIA